MTELTDYIISLTHLYGAVHKSVVVDIYNEHHFGQVTLEDVDYHLNHSSEILENKFVYVSGDYFINEAIAVFDDLENLLLWQQGKPRFVPDKTELFKYLDLYYFYKSPVYNDFFDYVKDVVLEGNTSKAIDVCEDVEGMIEANADFDMLVSIFPNMGVRFKNKKQEKTVRAFISKLRNHVRLWRNKGYTNAELQALGFNVTNGSGLNSITKKTKIGRNDPCPCGSGKKYKKCCLNAAK